MSNQAPAINLSIYDIAYYTVNRKLPYHAKTLASPPNVPVKKYKGLLVEEVLPDEILSNILSIKRIKIASISIGRDKYYPAHIVFSISDVKEAEQIANTINQLPKTFASFKPYNDKTTLICVSTRNWYRYHIPDNNSILKWFESIHNVIDNAINKE